MSSSIFETCTKCNQTILKSESKSHKCKPKITIKTVEKKQTNYNLSHSSFDSFNAIYSELGKIISYRIMPHCKHEDLIKALKQLSRDVSQNKNRTIDEEAFKVFEKVGKPMSGQAITYEINATYGFPVRKVEDVNVTLAGNRKVFDSDKYSTKWHLKNWSVQV